MDPLAFEIIAKIADITTIAEGLLTLWSSIKGVIANNKTINDTIDKSINKAKQKVRNRKWFEQPILISNTEILENVLLKANDEELSILGAQNIDVFNDIYDEIIKDKEFWEILQSLLTEHRLEILNGKAKAIQRKLDEVIVQIKTVVIAIEKANLSLDELRPYYPLDKELFVTEEENRKLYRDEALIEKTHQNLESKHVYLIQGSEGRGKTTLCRIIASDYYSQDIKVYFIDLKSNIGIEKIRKCCIEWNKTKAKTLIVLENIHASSDLGALVSLINSYKKDLCFLMNTRPTDDWLDCFVNWEEVVKLKPGIDDINGIIDLYSEEIQRQPFKNKEERSGFIERFSQKPISSSLGDSSNGVNLRLLNIYLETWKGLGEGRYVSDVKEEDILKQFVVTYSLSSIILADRKTLWYISCLFQFDVSLPMEFIPEAETSTGLLKLVKDGLLHYRETKYYLPHSVDAFYLYKVFCVYFKEDYVTKTNEYVNKYVDTILSLKDSRKYESDFKLLISGLLSRHAEFETLIKELTEWNKAKEIIEKIDSGFVIPAFHPQNGHTKETILASYKKDKETILPYILELSPGKLNQLRFLFENLLNYKDFCVDVFGNPDVLQKYLMKWYKILNTTSSLRVFNKNRKYKERIMNISHEHAIVINYKPPVQNGYRFNTTHTKITQYSISSRSMKYLFSLDAPKAEQFIRKINRKNGFYFKNCSWTHLGKMIHIIQSKSNDENRILCLGAGRKIVQGIVNEINKDSNAIQKATNEELSRFFNAVLDFDKNTFDNLMKNDVIIADAQFRLKWFDYSPSDLYLFSHFYSLNWCKEEINRLIDEANEKQIQEIKNWHSFIMSKLEKNQKYIEIEQGTLLDYIHNKFFSGQQNN